MVIICIIFAFFASPIIEATTQPNTIIFLADDLGYGDLASYGNTHQGQTPIDIMAEEGLRFTHWTSGSFMCSPSRASLMTGRYPRRNGVYGNSSLVFSPKSRGGLPEAETTLAEGLRDLGYSTGMVGKWHLGINEADRTDGEHLPHHHGFDWVGTNLPHGQSGSCDPIANSVAEMQGSCFLYNGSTVVEQPIDVKNLTRKLVDDALQFVRDKREEKFFLYFAFPQVHPALFCDNMFCGSSSERGLYGDSINEMAWAVGEILGAVKDLGIDENTLAVFSSDHGAPQSNCRSKAENAQTNGPFRGGKGTTWEGGYRVPAIAWWPGTIAPNTTSDKLVNHVDLFVTAIHLAGGASNLTNLENSEVVLDGQPISDLVPGVSERELVFYYCSDRLFAVRYLQYKLHYITMGSVAVSGGCKPQTGDYTCYEGADLIEHDPPIVFDLSTVDGESESIAEVSSNPDIQTIISTVAALVSDHEATFITTATSQIDRGNDKNLGVCCSYPDCECNFGDNK